MIRPAIAPLPIELFEAVVDRRLSRVAPAARAAGHPARELFWESMSTEVLREVPAARQAALAALAAHQCDATIGVEDLLRLIYGAKEPQYRMAVRWQHQGLLGQREPYSPIDTARAAALLMARQLIGAERERVILPAIDPTVPAWWCWRQDGPDQQPQPCPVPLAANLPAGALLWTPWAGAAWGEGWTAVGEGAARWAGEPTLGDLARWAGTVSEQTASELLQRLAAARLSGNQGGHHNREAEGGHNAER